MLDALFTEEIKKYLYKIIFPATLATLRMVFFTILIGFVAGLSIAVLLTLYGSKGLNPKRKLAFIFDSVINFIRSLPGIILIVALMPLSKLIVGTTIGESAVIVPLGISATAFIAKALESTFIEVDEQLIEAARSFGATDFQIVVHVIIQESIPSIVSLLTMSTVYYIAGTTIAGAVGGGGLGAVALNYGYQSFNSTVLFICVFIIYFMVQVVEWIGGRIYKKLSK